MKRLVCMCGIHIRQCIVTIYDSVLRGKCPRAKEYYQIISPELSYDDVRSIKATGMDMATNSIARFMPVAFINTSGIMRTHL